MLSPWSDQDRVDKLIMMWAAGTSATKIGEALNVSRNAVIGKAHRLKLGRRRERRRKILVWHMPEPEPVRTIRPSLTLVVDQRPTLVRRVSGREKTKNQLRDELARAWRNTADMQTADE